MCVAAVGQPVSAARAAEATAPAADPNRLFADSTLIVRDRISVEVTGAGPDLVLVPGLESSRATWRRTAERLRAHYRLHLVQVAGFSGEPARANATGRILVPTAEAIDAYIVEARLAPVVYIGHSLGGTMGLYLAEHHPEHLKKVLVVDSLPFYGVLMGGPTATADQLRPMADRIEAMMSAPTGPAADPTPMLAWMVKDPDGLKTVVGWSRLSDGAVGGRAMADDMTLDLRAGLPAVQTPITLIYPFDAGMGVPLAPWDALYNSQFAPLPHKTLVRVDDSRHFVMFDQPARFDAALDAFLAG
jgi:pimeloyl-ACP methyl ester carboxylesterase